MENDLFSDSPIATHRKASHASEPLPLLTSTQPVQPGEFINCGRCAHITKKQLEHGICACAARRMETNEINPPVLLISTCKHALLSAAFDPDFKRRLAETILTGKFPDRLSNPQILA